MRRHVQVQDAAAVVGEDDEGLPRQSASVSSACTVAYAWWRGSTWTNTSATHGSSCFRALRTLAATS
jgi:hypothetical protein